MKKYNTIVIDPPWDISMTGDKMKKKIKGKYCKDIWCPDCFMYNTCKLVNFYTKIKGFSILKPRLSQNRKKEKE